MSYSLTIEPLITEIALKFIRDTGDLVPFVKNTLNENHLTTHFQLSDLCLVLTFSTLCSYLTFCADMNRRKLL